MMKVVSTAMDRSFAAWPGVFCLLLAAPLSHGATLTSSAAHLPAGAACSSAAYAMQSAAGGWSEVGTGASAGDFLKPDFVGTFYDATELDVAPASGSSVSEGASVQCSARILCDDGSYLPTTPDLPWIVLAGPLAMNATSGLAQCAAVYRQETGVVQAATDGLTGRTVLLIADTDRDNYDTYAADNVADGWQVQYFGVGSAQGAAAADPDADGRDNFAEFIAGTLPTDPTSAFQLSIRRGQRMDLVFGPAFGARTYTVQESTNLRSSAWADYTGHAMQQIGLDRVITDTQAMHRAASYRVNIQYDWRSQP